MFDIEKVIEELKKRKPIFFSEAHFQLELAWVIKSFYGEAYEVDLEYTPSDPALNEKQKMHIDILLKDKESKKWIPIELKYKTKSCVITQDDEVFDMANHGAKDIGCYLYLNDIQRIERIKKARESQFEKGYAIMLTNDLSYIKPPRKSDCIYAAFSIDEGKIKTGTMKWGEAASPGTKKGIEEDINLDGKYKMEWKDYSILLSNDGKKVSFKYIVSQI